VNLLDRFLERVPVMRVHLQLVGVTALWVASKYEEMWTKELTLAKTVELTGLQYTKEDVKQQEWAMLSALKLHVCVPTVYTFLTRLFAASNIEEGSPVAHMAAYLAELCLLDYDYLRYLPSTLAAAVLNIAMRTFMGAGAWGKVQTTATGFDEASLHPLIYDIEDTMRRPAGATAVFRKYCSNSKSAVGLRPIATIFS
jgi:hypothetical protein